MTDIAIRAGRRQWTALAVLCLPLLMVSVDVSVLFFAVPHIAAQLHPSGTEILWIFDVYGFVLAGLLLTMGSVADRIGRRRLLLVGAAAFGGASVLAAYAPSPAWLVAARALLGVGGSTLMPSTLAIIRDLFVDAAQRAKAVSVWSAVLAGGVGLGPVLAGLLLDRYFWGSVFLVNVPVMLALLAVGPLVLPESHDPEARVDLVSAVLSLAAILPFVYVLKSVAAGGWSASLGAYAAVGLLAVVAFLRRQRSVAHPMVDLRLFAWRGFGGSIVVQLVGMFALMGNSILVTQYLQSVLGMSALTAALWSLVPSVVVAGAAPASVALAARHGRPRVMAGALLVAAAGLLAMRLTGVDTGVGGILVAQTLVAIGLVAVTALVTEYAIGIAPAQRAGSVSALVETVGELGGALGMAVLGSIVAARYAAAIDALTVDVPPAAREAARRTLGEAVGVAEQLGSAGAPLLEAARAAYVQAMHVADLGAGLLLVAAAALAVLALPAAPAEAAGPASPSPADQESGAG